MQPAWVRFVLIGRRRQSSCSRLHNFWKSFSTNGGWGDALQSCNFILMVRTFCLQCFKYRKMFDQTSRNRMREKVTASILFKDRKVSYMKRWKIVKFLKIFSTLSYVFLSISHPFLGDYVRLRQNVQWKKMCVEHNDQYVVFADIINKITRSSGKFVPILLVLSTSSMLLLDQRTLQIKYRVPASEIYRMSLSPFLDDIAVFHVKAVSFCR